VVAEAHAFQLDAQRVGDGVDFEKIQVDQALPVCKQAAERQPVRPRYQDLYGRVLDAAKRYPEAALLPANDLEAEAQAISWMSFIASTLHPARKSGVEHTKKVYGIADRRLGKNEWALGRYSIADIHLFRLYWRLAGALKPARGTFPTLEAHHDRMMARPAVRKTIEIESAIGYELPAWFPDLEKPSS
jgi:hypothetical protein